MYEKVLNSNQQLYQSSVGEAINEWLTSEEPVVSVSEYYIIKFDTDYAGDIRVHEILDSYGTSLWENWNATCWTEAEDKLISELIIFGELV